MYRQMKGHRDMEPEIVISIFAKELLDLHYIFLRKLMELWQKFPKAVDVKATAAHNLGYRDFFNILEFYSIWFIRYYEISVIKLDCSIYFLALMTYTLIADFLR